MQTTGWASKKGNNLLPWGLPFHWWCSFVFVHRRLKQKHYTKPIEEKRRGINPPTKGKAIFNCRNQTVGGFCWEILPINRNPSSSPLSFPSQLDQILSVRVSPRFSKWLVLQFSQSYMGNVTGYCFIYIEPLISPAQYDSYVSSEYCNHYICRIFCCFPSVIVGNYNNMLKWIPSLILLPESSRD